MNQDLNKSGCAVLQDKIVRIRFRRISDSKPAWMFIGRVLYFSDSWIGVEGKGILIYLRKTGMSDSATLRGDSVIRNTRESKDLLPMEIDEETRTLVFPRDNILSIRVLPDDFDIDAIKVQFSGRRIDLLVPGAPNSALDEIYDD